MFESSHEKAPPGALMLCLSHDTELREMLAAEGLGAQEPYVRAAQGLIRLGVSAVGSESMLQYGSGCPVCTFKVFPFIRGVVDVILPPKKPG